jgi:hypothetical protein
MSIEGRSIAWTYTFRNFGDRELPQTFGFHHSRDDQSLATSSSSSFPPPQMNREEIKSDDSEDCVDDENMVMKVDDKHHNPSLMQMDNGDDDDDNGRKPKLEIPYWMREVESIHVDTVSYPNSRWKFRVFWHPGINDFVFIAREIIPWLYDLAHPGWSDRSIFTTVQNMSFRHKFKFYHFPKEHFRTQLPVSRCHFHLGKGFPTMPAAPVFGDDDDSQKPKKEKKKNKKMKMDVGTTLSSPSPNNCNDDDDHDNDHGANDTTRDHAVILNASNSNSDTGNDNSNSSSSNSSNNNIEDNPLSTIKNTQKPRYSYYHSRKRKRRFGPNANRGVIALTTRGCERWIRETLELECIYAPIIEWIRNQMVPNARSQVKRYEKMVSSSSSSSSA